MAVVAKIAIFFVLVSFARSLIGGSTPTKGILGYCFLRLLTVMLTVAVLHATTISETS